MSRPAKQAIVISGTHGKTTTSSIIAWVLYQAGLDPSFIIGGILKDFDSNCRLGSGRYIVLEGDEYDTAFFDKGAKFLHYDPAVAVLTGVEFDHADIFRDLAHVKETFGAFIAGISEAHLLIAFDRDRNVGELRGRAKCRLARYGGPAQSDWQLGAVSVQPPWTHFEVMRRGQPYGKFKTRPVGTPQPLEYSGGDGCGR